SQSHQQRQASKSHHSRENSLLVSARSFRRSDLSRLRRRNAASLTGVNLEVDAIIFDRARDIALIVTNRQNFILRGSVIAELLRIRNTRKMGICLGHPISLLRLGSNTGAEVTGSFDFDSHSH